MKPAQIDDLINRASTAARVATQAHLDAFPNDWYPCGFAWVIIKPATGPLVKRLKELDLGSKAYGGGLQVWNPAKNNTQCMDALYKGAVAFANVLKAEGVNCYADSRID